MSTKVKTHNLSLVMKDVTNSVKSFQLSKRYVQRFLKIGAINIIYRRIDIPEPEFELKNYENISYVVFKRKSTNDFIRDYHFCMYGILDAFEKDYLKEIFLYILDKDTDAILESYSFKIKYNKDASQLNTNPYKIRNATVEFLQAFENIPGKKWPSNTVKLSMEFSYNKGTPSKYEPPNFEPAKQPLCFNLHSDKIELGSVNTGFHKVSASGRGENFTLSRASTPAPSTYIEEESPDLNMNSQEKKQQEEIKRRIKDMGQIQNKKLKIENARIDSPFIDITSEMQDDNITIASSEEHITCMCNWELPKEFETTRCTKCYGIVHLVCHGYFTLTSVDEDKFLCYQCADPKADSLNMNRLMKLRIILYGIHLKKELPTELDITSGEERTYILGQLDKLGVHSFKAKGRQDIDFNKLREALLTAFAIENSEYFE